MFNGMKGTSLSNSPHPHSKHSSKGPSTTTINRIPMWISMGELSQQLKQQILSDRKSLSHVEQVFLTRYLMESVKQRPDRTDKSLLRKLLMSKKVCQHLIGLPFELILSSLELEFKPKGSILVKIGENYEKIYFLIQGSCEAVTYRTEVIVYDSCGIFGEKETMNAVRSDVTVRCKTEAWFIVLKKNDYLSAFKRVKLIQSKEVLAFITKVPIIRTFGEEVLKKISPLFEKVQLVEKQFLVRQDELPVHISIIAEGQFRATFKNAQNIECPILILGACEMLCLQSLFKVPSKFDVICTSKLSTIFRVNAQKFSKALNRYSPANTPLLQNLKDFAKLRTDNNSELVDVSNSRTGFLFTSRIRKSHSKSSRQMSSESSKSSQPGQNLKLKVKFFSKELTNTRQIPRKSREAWAIRSKKDNPKHIFEVFDCPQDEGNECFKIQNQKMIKAYRQKLKKSKVQLDIVEKLYSDTKRRRHHRSLSAQNRPQKSKNAQTQMLMKRIQMSSCKKRMNRLICMFDPKQIVDFAQGASFSQQL